jgi:hypothetical protein
MQLCNTHLLPYDDIIMCIYIVFIGQNFSKN